MMKDKCNNFVQDFWVLGYSFLTQIAIRLIKTIRMLLFDINSQMIISTLLQCR